MNKERWLPVVGFEGRYEVSDCGRVRSVERVVFGKTKLGAPLPRLHKARVLASQIGRHGYVLYHLYLENKRTCRSAHSLVAEAFLGPRSKNHEVAHGDGDRSNNRASNLRHATRAENHFDKRKHGTHLAGEKHPLAKLSLRDVKRIRALSGTHESIAKQFPVSRRTVSRIRQNEAWANA